MVHFSYLPNPRKQANEGLTKSLLNSPYYNPTVTVSSSDRWTPFFSVPQWYDAVATLCHLFSRGNNHVIETSRVDHYRAPCGHRRIAQLVPTLVGWDDHCVPLSYKKGKPFRGVAIAKSRLLSSSTVSPLLFSPSASFWPTRH
jgi:hypothetical protein